MARSTSVDVTRRDATRGVALLLALDKGGVFIIIILLF
jgi:hypothetical protein